MRIENFIAEYTWLYSLAEREIMVILNGQLTLEETIEFFRSKINIAISDEFLWIKSKIFEELERFKHDTSVVYKQ